MLSFPPVLYPYTKAAEVAEAVEPVDAVDTLGSLYFMIRRREHSSRGRLNDIRRYSVHVFRTMIPKNTL